VVAGVVWTGGGGEEEDPPPHPTAREPMATQARMSTDSQRLRRKGIAKRSSPASAAPPVRHGSRLRGLTSELVEAAVVVTVRVVVLLPEAASVTLAGFRLQAGRLCAPEGLCVSAQVTFMVPEYVLPALSVTAAVALLPGATADGAGIDISTAETVTVAVPVALL